MAQRDGGESGAGNRMVIMAVDVNRDLIFGTYRERKSDYYGGLRPGETNGELGRGATRKNGPVCMGIPTRSS